MVIPKDIESNKFEVIVPEGIKDKEIEESRKIDDENDCYYRQQMNWVKKKKLNTNMWPKRNIFSAMRNGEPSQRMEISHAINIRISEINREETHMDAPEAADVPMDAPNDGFLLSKIKKRQTQKAALNTAA
ncbi:hypothetical protein HHI36_009751 [Cryptolaemus montrouzieri]|uniref:Uncharacterized protein n=1 Tax=Cryptolaemus montrouzieri TaxID=559131 RepID=A0ABD2MGQ5_9CUCU